MEQSNKVTQDKPVESKNGTWITKIINGKAVTGKISDRPSYKADNGVPLFCSKEPKGSINQWRNRVGTGGVPGFFAMSEIKPFEKENNKIQYCQCKNAVVNAETFHCIKCKNRFDATENKKLVSFIVKML